MSPLVRVTVAIAVLSALSSAVHRPIEPKTLAVAVGSARPAGEQTTAVRPCPPGFLPDNRACIPVPESGSREQPQARSGASFEVYDRLPRRPDRPAAFDRYTLPLELVDVVEASPLGAPGNGLLLMGAQGEPVLSRVLEGQQGPTTVSFTGELVGRTVVTKHRVREGRREHDYLVVHGNLARIETRAGRVLKAGTKLGEIGTRASGPALGLHLEVRRVRHGFDSDKLAPPSFLDPAHTIVADARNVFKTKDRSAQ